MRGKSWQPHVESGALTGQESPYVVHGDDDPAIGWELFGRAALRRGRYKIVHMAATEHGKGKWELFDLDLDQGETKDLAAEKPDLLVEMVGLWAKYVEETGTVWDPDWSISTASFVPVNKDRLGGDPTDDQVSPGHFVSSLARTDDITGITGWQVAWVKARAGQRLQAVSA